MLHCFNKTTFVIDLVHLKKFFVKLQTHTHTHTHLFQWFFKSYDQKVKFHNTSPIKYKFYMHAILQYIITIIM